jgi:hypothetical protein
MSITKMVKLMFRGESTTSRQTPLNDPSHENEVGEQNRSSGGGEMKHRQETIAEKAWDGEFETYDERARFEPQPPYRSATFLDGQGRRCITQQDFARAREDGAFPVRYRWETADPRKT